MSHLDSNRVPSGFASCEADLTHLEPFQCIRDEGMGYVVHIPSIKFLRRIEASI